MSEPRTYYQKPEWARTHTHIIGPTGSGKSSLMVSMALDDLDNGVGIAPWMDPKDNQAADAFLARIPDKFADRVVVMDPDETDYAIGLNVLDVNTPERRDVVVDQIVAVFAQLFKDSWGRRQAETLYMGLTTLLHHDNVTLCDLPRLLMDPALRMRMLRKVQDPDLLSYWERYENLSDGEIAPLLGRLQSLLLRPRVRNIIGQRKSTVDLADILNNGGVVIARLPLELAMTSQLLGSFLFLRCWQVIQSRQKLPEDQRKDAAAYLDEGELFMHIKGSVASVFDLSRSGHWGIVFGNQRMGQLTESGSELAEALNVNALTKIVVGRPTTLDNAKAVAPLVPPLTAEALLNLTTRQAAVRFPVGTAFVGRTPELPDPIRDPKELAQHAMKRWGRPREEIEKEIAEGLKGRGRSDGPSEYDKYV